MTSSAWPKKTIKQLSTALRRLAHEGGDDNFVVFGFDAERNIYVQFAMARGEGHVHAEVVGNAYLPSAARLGADGLDALERRGWRLAGPELANHTRAWKLGGERLWRAIAEHALETLHAVYGVDPDTVPRVVLNLA